MTGSPNLETGPRSVINAPGPRGLPWLGSALDMGSQGMIQFWENLWHAYGDVVRVQVGPITQHLIVRPEHIKHVLVDNAANYWKGIGMTKLKLSLGTGLFTNEGESWRRQRRLMQPPFTPRGVNQFGPTMIDAIERLLAGWHTEAPGAKTLDINQEMMNLAMSVIARTMFNVDVTKAAADAAIAFTYVLEFLSTKSMALIDLPRSVPTPSNVRFNRAMSTIDSFIRGIIQQRQAEADPPQDLLTMLLSARDEETGQGMSEQQVRDEVITIFFAGHETTAQALTWTWFLLAQHPEAEAKLHAELAQVLGGRMPTLDDIPQLPYTRMVLDEAMRIYPPIWVFVRDAIADDEIGGYHIPAGSMIVFSQYITHRHPAYWEDPLSFEPERFSPERAKDRPRYAYFPFGGGPRVCIGKEFALLEGVLALAAIGQRYRLRLAPGQSIAPKMVGTLRPNGPVMMRLERRA